MGQAQQKKKAAEAAATNPPISVVLTQEERLTLIQVVYHKDEKGKDHEKRLARQRVAEALGIRKGKDWATLQIDQQTTVITIGAEVNGKFKAAKKIGDRIAQVTPEAVDIVLGAIERRGGDVGDEDTLIGLVEKFRDVKAGGPMEVPSDLPGIREPSDADEFPELDDEE